MKEDFQFKAPSKQKEQKLKLLMNNEESGVFQTKGIPC